MASRKVVDISQRLLPFQQAITVPAHKAYCVYTHTYQGTVFYVGRGSQHRPFHTVQRNIRWHAFVAQIHAYEVSIVLWTDDEALARAEEAQLIARFRPSCNGRPTREQLWQALAVAPRKKARMRSISLPQDLYDLVKMEAERNYRSFSAQIQLIIEQWAAAHGSSLSPKRPPR